MIPPAIAGNQEFHPLQESDQAALASRWITPEGAEAAYLRRVASLYGAELVGRGGRAGAGDYSGIAIPYLWPGDSNVYLYRLRRDHPDMEAGPDGRMKPRQKYMNAPGAGNRLYLPPQTQLAHLDDPALPVIIVEGEFKALALWRLAWHGLGDVAETPAFLPVGLSGVWNWRGVIGKTEDEHGARVDVKGAIADLGRVEWRERRTVILFDADIEKNYMVKVARDHLTRTLEDRGAEVAWFAWPGVVPAEQKGIDDFLAANGPEPVLRLLARSKLVTKARKRVVSISEAIAGDDSWRLGLLRGDKGVKPILANAMTALRAAPTWTGALVFNEFAMRTEVCEGTPWHAEPYQWGDTDDTMLAEWLQRAGIEVNVGIAAQAAEAVARERAFHPVRDYVDALVWDRTPRIDTWLQTYFGAKDTPYERAVGARWLISAIARVQKPSCQVDHCMVLQGPQGKGKSSALRVLGEPWFTDDIEELGSKESAIQLLGVWIVELGELSQIVGQRAELERVKSFITRRVDHFRPPYGRRTADFARQCVFSGSINGDTYFTDETGARRFWPVMVERADVEGLRRDRDQIWAEARARWGLGEKWHLHEAELVTAAEDEQDARFRRDPWDLPVWDYLEGARVAWEQGGQPIGAFRVTMAEILAKACEKHKDNWTRADSNRVCAIMRLRGLEYKRERVYNADGNPELAPDGKHVRDYFFRWPDAVTTGKH